jgi:DinB superfamily
MDAKQAIRMSMGQAENIVDDYLKDLSDAELLVRPLPGANHIAWQLGHLIQSEHEMLDMVSPGSMPKLPEGFEQKHTKDTAGSDDPKTFLKKDEYVRLQKEQRAGTLAVLAKIDAGELAKPGPEPMRDYFPTVADIIGGQATHWLMHAGQWAIVRRKLGRKPMY